MNALLTWARREPLRAMAIAQAVLAACATFLPEAATTAILGIMAAVLGVGVRGAVTPVVTAEVRVVEAARAAAQATAGALNDASAGVTGEVTPAAQATINGIVADVVGRA